jgi:hypothetical protein
MSGVGGTIVKTALLTPMYGPAVRCKRFVELAVSGLASMYPVSDWSMCSGPSWISARTRSHYRTGLNGGHLGHQCSHAPGRPILHRRLILSQTSAGSLSYVIDSSSSYLYLFLCSCLATVPSSRPAAADAPRAGAVKAGRRAGLASRFDAARPRLDRPEHGSEDYAARDISSVLSHAKARPLLRTAQATRASLLASAIASTLWCSRFFAASIHDLSP